MRLIALIPAKLHATLAAPCRHLDANRLQGRGWADAGCREEDRCRTGRPGRRGCCAGCGGKPLLREDSQKLFSHFREMGRKYHANTTYFLSGVYMPPKDKRELCDPPKRNVSSSDIGFNEAEGIRNTISRMRGAWEDGDEIGTCFNGHFCGPEGGVGTWSVDQWKSEIDRAKSFVKSWKSNDAGLKDEKPLPFDYDKELIGGRTPCLEGQKNMVAAARATGFRYDSSGVNKQVWPKKKDGIWGLSISSPGTVARTCAPSRRPSRRSAPRRVSAVCLTHAAEAGRTSGAGTAHAGSDAYQPGRRLRRRPPVTVLGGRARPPS